MNIAFGTDHGGFSLKKPIIEKLICIGARVINEETAIKIIELFLSSKFNIKEKKYKRRLDKLINIEKKYK